MKTREIVRLGVITLLLILATMAPELLFGRREWSLIEIFGVIVFIQWLARER